MDLRISMIFGIKNAYLIQPRYTKKKLAAVYCGLAKLDFIVSSLSLLFPSCFLPRVEVSQSPFLAHFRFLQFLSLVCRSHHYFIL